ncbi:MAG TPA: hypothetical protein VF062_23395 [Candidatus Limnocylindrales bacterium]
MTRPNSAIEAGVNPIESQLEELLDQYGADLRKALDNGTYRDGEEQDYANMALGGLFASSEDDRFQRDLRASLRHLAYDHLHADLIGVTCLLDGTDEGSYEVAAKMTDILVTAIAGQDGEYAALHALVVDEIVDRAEVAHLMPATPAIWVHRRSSSRFCPGTQLTAEPREPRGLAPTCRNCGAQIDIVGEVAS